jgi:hypothetical protein
MIRQTGTKVVQLTRELAEEFAKMPSWKGERPVRQDRLQMLIDKIDRGLFYSPAWAVATLGGKTTRMNGQHSSLALLQCGTFPTGLQATILSFDVDRESELAELFDQFDNPQSARRMKDVLNAHAAIEAGLPDCSAHVLQRILSGIAVATGQFSNDTNSERAALMHIHTEFIRFAEKFSAIQHLLYQAVLAAMYLTWKRDAVRAWEFWTAVANERHPSADNATRVLARFLVGEVAGRGRRGGMRWDRRAVTVKCLHAWNAYWRDGFTSLKYVASAPVPPIA